MLDSLCLQLDLNGKEEALMSAHSFKEKLDLLGELPNLKIYRWINKAKNGEGSEHSGAYSSAIIHFLPN